MYFEEGVHEVTRQITKENNELEMHPKGSLEVGTIINITQIDGIRAHFNFQGLRSGTFNLVDQSGNFCTIHQQSRR